MKTGSEYETFIFEAFKRFFPSLKCVKNDKIRGLESGLLREIDISLTGEVAGTNILYVTQAKDHARPADINVVGAFSAAMKDVGASRGFLLCAAGFAKTVKTYARRCGIELLTVEDISSERWKAQVEIPIALIKYEIHFGLTYSALPTKELSDVLGNEEMTISVDEFLTSLDGGLTFGSLKGQIKKFMDGLDLDLKEGHEIAILDDRIRVKLRGCVLPVSDASLQLTPRPKRYMKYVKPEEYLVIKDHLVDMQIPVNFKLCLGSLTLDESWEALPDGALPVRPAGISIDCEMNPDGLNEVIAHSMSVTLE